MRIVPGENAPYKLQSGGAPPGTLLSKGEYMKLCNEITSDTILSNDRYEEIIQGLLEYLKIKSLSYIANVSSEFHEEMTSNLEEIFTNIDNTDTNYIGRINVVSLQCIILFTIYSLKVDNCVYNVDSERRFLRVFDRDSWPNYNMLTKGDWVNYKFIVSQITTMPSMKSMKNFYYTYDYTITPYIKNGIKVFEKAMPIHLRNDPLSFKYLIIAVDYLNLDEIICSFLNKVSYCGFASTFTYADGQLLTPYEFVIHDMAHGMTNIRYCSDESLIYNDVKDFYDYCKKSLNKDHVYYIKFVLFYLLHESPCNFFNDNYKDIILKISTRYLMNLPRPINRFLDLNDLGGIIPRDIRGDAYKIKDYISNAIDVFVENRDKWRESQKSSTLLRGGSRKNKSKRTQKQKQKRSKRIRKMKG